MIGKLKHSGLIIVLALLMLFFVVMPERGFAAIEPTITAESGIVYCVNTGELVFTKDENKKLQPYSVTKLMTAIVTVMHTPLDKKVKVSKNAASQGGSSAGLIEGEEVTIEQLLYGALVKSGNDAAYALAEGSSYGSVKKFVKQMNKTAKNIGCRDTHFADPAGLYDKNNYTTVSDLLQIVKIAFDNDVIKEAAGTEKYTMKQTNKSGTRVYTSGAFDLDDSVYAGKNGQWYDVCTSALGCEIDGLDLYVILLGDTADGRKSDLKALLKYSTDKIDGVLAVKGGEKVGSVHVKHGEVTRLDVYTESDGYAYIPTEGSRALIKTELSIDDDVYAPLNSGDQVGVYKIKVGGETVNEVPLIVKKSVAEGWPTSYLGISNRAAGVIGIVLVIVLALLILVLVLRLINSIRRTKERRKRAMEIARREMEEEEERRRRGWDV